MNKGIIAYVALLVVVIILAYVFTGFKFLSKKTTTTSTSLTTTIQTTVSIPPYTTINYSVQPCSKFLLIGENYNTTYKALCRSNGSIYGVWVSAGNSGTESVKIIGADNRTYVNQSSNYKCLSFFENWTGPPELYSITFTTGPGGGSCGNADLIINTTTTPPKSVTYNNIIYNGNFGNGEYTGWSTTGNGFGTSPLNITYENSVMCYYGQQWANYNGTFFATTYNCGTSVAPGNLTSSQFLVNPAKPFLNFRLISPQDNFLYVEILSANYTPLVIAHYNTYNLSRSLNASSTFANVTIPLTQYVNQVMRIRVVAITENTDNYIAVGDFYLSNRPVQDPGLDANLTVLNS